MAEKEGSKTLGSLSRVLEGLPQGFGSQPVCQDLVVDKSIKAQKC